MKLFNSANQSVQHPLFTADITLTGSAQLVLARSASRSSLILQNLGTHTMWIEFGSARATATLTSGTVSSVAVTNAGFNFTKPPLIRFMGGGFAGNSSYLGLNQPGGESPNSDNGLAGRPAAAHCVLTAGAVSSIVVDDPGAGYAIAPYCFIFNSDLDPYGCALPAITGTGISLSASTMPIAWNGSVCHTDPVSVIGTSGDKLLARWMD